MRENIVTVYKNEPVVATGKLAKGFGVEHRAIKRLINRYKSEFEEWGVITTALPKPSSEKGGRPLDEYLLNEPQTTYLATLLTNNEIVRKFKRFLTNEFFRQRRLLNQIALQSHNEEWLEKRTSGKIERNVETDTIKKFVEYATNQGSQSAKKYYMAISKMENQTIFALDFVSQKFENLRDVINIKGLDLLKTADQIVSRAINQGMEKQLPYKEIYQFAKERVETFVEIMGKTPINEVLPGIISSIEEKGR